MFAVTPRLLLRPGWPEDAAELRDAIADEAIVRNLASAPWPYRLADAERFLAMPQDDQYPRWLIFTRLRSVPRLVGTIGIDRTEATGVELGYWIARDHWGRGYATEAGQAAINTAGILGHNKLHAAHFTDNPASGAVLRKLGFRATGRVVKRYSLGRDQESNTVEYERDLAGEDGPAGSDMRPIAA